jgi:hypothetical protein
VGGESVQDKQFTTGPDLPGQTWKGKIHEEKMADLFLVGRSVACVANRLRLASRAS